MCNTAKLCNTNAEALNKSINDSNAVIIIIIISACNYYFNSHLSCFSKKTTTISDLNKILKNLPKVDYNNMPTSITV